jgi:hypothetical protein
MFARPSSEQERWMALASRLGIRRDAPWLDERIGGWTAVTLFTRCALFVLGIVAASTTAAVFRLLHIPHSLFVSGLVLLAVAEWLLRNRRLFGAGIEEALEVAGLLLIAFDVVDGTGDAHGIRASLMVAVALILAGTRLLNPLLITLAALALSVTIDLTIATDRPVAVPAAIAACVFCFSAAAIALALGRLQFRRPSYDRVLDWLVVAMPLAAYLWLEGGYLAGSPLESLRTVSFVQLLTILMPVAFGIVALTVGVLRRRHAPLLAFIVCAGCVAYELRNLTGLSIEARLIVWGSVALALAFALDRYLRTPRRGITSSRVGRDGESRDLLQLVGAGALAPASPQPAPFEGGGGTSAGGGASGSY